MRDYFFLKLNHSLNILIAVILMKLFKIALFKISFDKQNFLTIKQFKSTESFM